VNFADNNNNNNNNKLNVVNVDFGGIIWKQGEYRSQLHLTINKDKESWLRKYTVPTGMYCAIRKWKLGCVVLCKIICEMQDAQLFMALSSPNADQIDSVSCERLFQIYWHLAAVTNTNYHTGNVKETLRITLFTVVGLIL